MSTNYGQQWQRNFGPLFSGPYSDQHMRVSDAERQAVADRLGEHFSSGRLDQAEFDERVGQAMSAKTRGDLNGLFDDLPETGAPARPEHPRSRRRHPILLVALIVVIVIATVHIVAWTFPWLLLGFFAMIVLFATRTAGHSRSNWDQDR